MKLNKLMVLRWARFRGAVLPPVHCYGACFVFV